MVNDKIGGYFPNISPFNVDMFTEAFNSKLKEEF